MAAERPETIAVNEVFKGRLPAAATGVHWTDTGQTECRQHLGHTWRETVTLSDEPTGTVLYGALTCDHGHPVTDPTISELHWCCEDIDQAAAELAFQRAERRRILARCIANGLTLAEIGAEVGRSRQTVHQWTR